MSPVCGHEGTVGVACMNDRGHEGDHNGTGRTTWPNTTEETPVTVTPTVIDLPEEPPVGTGLIDRFAMRWTRETDGWRRELSATGDEWSYVMSRAPLTVVPTPPARTLPTHDGAFIRASGADSGTRFDRTVLTFDGSNWWSLDGNVTVHPGLDGDHIDSDWTELILVEKDEHDRMADQLARVREALANHPDICEEDGKPWACGWKRAVEDARHALADGDES